MGRKQDAEVAPQQGARQGERAAALRLRATAAGREEAGRGAGGLPLERQEVPGLLDFASRPGPRLQRAGRF